MNRIFIALGFIAIFSLGACTKCTECTVYNKYDEVDSAINAMEECGKEKDIEEFEKMWTAYADSIQGRAECFRQ